MGERLHQTTAHGAPIDLASPNSPVSSPRSLCGATRPPRIADEGCSPRPDSRDNTPRGEWRSPADPARLDHWTVPSKMTGHRSLVGCRECEEPHDRNAGINDRIRGAGP